MPRIIQPPQPRIVRPTAGPVPQPPTPKSNILHPISLYAACTIRPGEQGVINAMALRNPRNLPMEILEIKWQIIHNSGASFTGAAVTCGLMLGKLKITNSLVPVWLFGRCENLQGELILGDGSVNSISVFSWKLPRPLYIPPGAVLMPTLQHTGQTKKDITVGICYSGRVLKRALDPKGRFPVPYVAAWQSKTFDQGLADADSSKEHDLVNATGQDVRLVRLASRLAQTTGGFSYQSAPQDTEFFTIDMFDSRGFPWVLYPSTYDTVFSPHTRTWEMPEEPVLEAGQYVIANLTKKAAVNNIPAAGTVYDQLGISIVGWRSVNPAEATLTEEAS